MLNLLLFVVGLVVGSWWFTVTVLPLVYGVPKSLLYWKRGILGIQAMWFYVATAVIWNIVFIVVALLLLMISRKIAYLLFNSPGFFGGQWAGIILMAIRALTLEGRRDLHEDFLSRNARWSKSE